MLYLQVPLHPESRKYVTIKTHMGLYQYTRLPFGVASVPAIFQRIMEGIFQGIWEWWYILTISGKDEQEHLKRSEQVILRLEDRGLRVKRDKCKFLRSSVEYLGYRLDREGIHSLNDKVIAIVKAPEPRNVKELRAFLGLTGNLSSNYPL